MKTLKEMQDTRIVVSLPDFAEKSGMNLDHYSQDTKEFAVYEGMRYINVQKDGTFVLHLNRNIHDFENLEQAEYYLWYNKVIHDELNDIPLTNCCGVPFIEESSKCSKCYENAIPLGEDDEIEKALIEYLQANHFNTNNPVVKGVAETCVRFINKLIADGNNT